MDNKMKESTLSSPCNGICTLDDLDNVCIGCFRSQQEIMDWRGSSPTQRQAILNRAKERKALRS
jgi:uncharacterized protein